MSIDPDGLEEVRRLNVVIHEDDETITAVAPCPTASHQPEKVRPTYAVRFTCPHGESVNVFCTPCAGDRLAGTWACLDRERRQADDDECPGSVVVEVLLFTPRTIEKRAS